MTRRPPRSTLFPTRRSSDLGPALGAQAQDGSDHTQGRQQQHACLKSSSAPANPRSEEHTSELQSLTNLVCRLLLEKKKNKQTQLHKQINNNTKQKHIKAKTH